MPIHNTEIAAIFNELADLLEIEGANRFRIRAYRNAAITIANLPESLAGMIEAGKDLSELPTIGKDLAAKIAEIIATGHLVLLDQLERSLPGELAKMMTIPGLGPKRVKVLHEQADVDSLETLRQAAMSGKLRHLPGFGKKTESKILHELGDPMERALLLAGRKAGMERRSLLGGYPEIEEHAFDPDLKMMATTHADKEWHVLVVKGAPESVIERCAKVLGSEGERGFDDMARRVWMERSDDATRRGFRLLALVMKRAADADAEPYADLTLVGLVCLADSVRPDVPHAIAACKEAGVKVIMLTGDHAETAGEIARQAGLGDGEIKVIQGREIGDLDPAQLDEREKQRILAADVFARVTPEMKLKLATLFQLSGDIVAMTGDGVNDAPVLKKADIGIAMGQRGTEVAREAAHMVLKDDAFPTIIAAMREGRIIFDNIRRFVVYLMSCNVSEVLVVGIAVGVGLPAPLLPLQILFLNLVTDVFPAFALSLARAAMPSCRAHHDHQGSQWWIVAVGPS